MDLYFYLARNHFESDVIYAACHRRLHSQTCLKHSASYIHPWILIVWNSVHLMHSDCDDRGYPFVLATWTYLRHAVLYAVRI